MMATHPIYQFYAELDDYKPKIWRRFQVTDNITPARLCYIIQVLFEMTASHLMALEVPLKMPLNMNAPDLILRFEIMDEDFEDLSAPHRNVRVCDATEGTLRRIKLHPGSTLNFNYDFGDDWWVTLTLVEIIEDKDLPGSELPRVLDGAGFGIIEDCGGVGGLMDLAAAFKKKKGADYKEFREWLGVDNLNMDAFDLEDMNFRLKKIPRIYKQCYEDRLKVTQRSIDLIERKYLRG